MNEYLPFAICVLASLVAATVATLVTGRIVRGKCLGRPMTFDQLRAKFGPGIYRVMGEVHKDGYGMNLHLVRYQNHPALYLVADKEYLGYQIEVTHPVPAPRHVES